MRMSGNLCCIHIVLWVCLFVYYQLDSDVSKHGLAMTSNA